MFFKKKPKLKDLKLGTKFVKAEKTVKKRVPLELKPYAELVKIADELFGDEVKRRADLGGYVICYTCNAYLSYSPDKGNPNLHCSHFQSRRSHLIRWNFDNARVACKNCNSFNQGRIEVFEAKLIKELGLDRVNELKAIAVAPNIHDREFMIETIKSLRIFLKQK